MTEPRAELAGLRDRLDALDRDIVELIAQRFDVVGSIGEQKAGSDQGIRDIGRERAVLDSVEKVARARGVPVSLVRRIFEELLTQSVTRQASGLSGHGGEKVRVAYQGVEHAYSFLAAHKYLGGRQAEGVLTGYRSFSAAVAAECLIDALRFLIGAIYQLRSIGRIETQAGTGFGD